MRVLVWCAVILALVMPLPAATAEEEQKQAADQRDLVVILHGIGHTRWNMYGAERALEKQGYETFSITYPSRTQTIGRNAKFLKEKLDEAGIWQRPGRVHFVTHSMGGLVAKRYLADNREDIPADKIGRFVMIAPPNGGSEIADLLKGFPPYKWLFGPAGQELTTEIQAQNDAAPWYDLGIIAGTIEWPYFIAAFVIPGVSDGRVAVENTKLSGMKDHITLPATHSFISWKGKVHKQVAHFLKEGAFTREKVGDIQ